MIILSFLCLLQEANQPFWQVWLVLGVACPQMPQHLNEWPEVQAGFQIRQKRKMFVLLANTAHNTDTMQGDKMRSEFCLQWLELASKWPHEYILQDLQKSRSSHKSEKNSHSVCDIPRGKKWKGIIWSHIKFCVWSYRRWGHVFIKYGKLYWRQMYSEFKRRI